MPTYLTDLAMQFESMSSWFLQIGPYFVAVVTAAAVIWTSAIAWRKFKESTNKV